MYNFRYGQRLYARLPLAVQNQFVQQGVHVQGPAVHQGDILLKGQGVIPSQEGFKQVGGFFGDGLLIDGLMD